MPGSLLIGKLQSVLITPAWNYAQYTHRPSALINGN